MRISARAPDSKKIDAAIEAIKLRRSEKDREIATQKSRKFDIQRKIDRMEADLAHMKTDKERWSMRSPSLRRPKPIYRPKTARSSRKSTEVQQQHRPAIPNQ
jgi:chromosome segregation protein